MRVPLTAFFASGLAFAFAAPAAADAVTKGRDLVTKNCGACHAIGASGPSPKPPAPEFRTLGKKYPVESLEEALAEGAIAGHPDMPEVELEAPDVVAIIAYLKSIQRP